MAALNDSIIIGSVLVLVFGALFYYLYSRLLYSEKRVNVMENILLDLKTASETFFTSSSSSEENYPTETVYHSTTTIGEIDSNETVGSLAEELVPDVAPETNTTTEVSSNKVSLNYESMNLKELQAEARTRNISGVSAMRRKEIIENLRRTDNESSLPLTSTDVSTPIEIEA